jgi:hypothetical protein
MYHPMIFSKKNLPVCLPRKVQQMPTARSVGVLHISVANKGMYDLEQHTECQLPNLAIGI